MEHKAIWLVYLCSLLSNTQVYKLTKLFEIAIKSQIEPFFIKQLNLNIGIEKLIYCLDSDHSVCAMHSEVGMVDAWSDLPENLGVTSRLPKS